MDLIFEIGDKAAPVGHALLYFTAPSGEVYGTYVQTFPIAMNFSQYLPQIFASMVPADQIDAQTATAMPPVAQVIEEGVEWLRETASARRDDLVNAGTLYSVDAVNVMGVTQEAVAEYSELYRQRPAVQPAMVPPSVDRYADLTEGERLAEVTKLVGRVRDTLGGPDADQARADLQSLASTLPAKYRTDDLIAAATEPGDVGQQLATLNLQRAYKLLNEEYLEVADIERQIRDLTPSNGQSGGGGTESGDEGPDTEDR